MSSFLCLDFGFYQSLMFYYIHVQFLGGCESILPRRVNVREHARGKIQDQRYLLQGQAQTLEVDLSQLPIMAHRSSRLTR